MGERRASWRRMRATTAGNENYLCGGSMKQASARENSMYAWRRASAFLLSTRCKRNRRAAGAPVPLPHTSLCCRIALRAACALAHAIKRAAPDTRCEGSCSINKHGLWQHQTRSRGRWEVGQQRGCLSAVAQRVYVPQTSHARHFRWCRRRGISCASQWTGSTWAHRALSGGKTPPLLLRLLPPRPASSRLHAPRYKGIGRRHVSVGIWRTSNEIRRTGFIDISKIQTGERSALRQSNAYQYHIAKQLALNADSLRLVVVKLA